eukprot:GHRR01032421.1.p2 GENE.GHRR01032421.1~~GHRR01032421.1.p2  ORF type:complete len:115 (+),score=35.51 GHRR01032421.1:928-1272(+)
MQVLGFVTNTNPVVDGSETGQGKSLALWESQAVLMLWLSILVLLPFDLVILDSSVGAESSGAKGKGYPPLAANIMEVCKVYLEHPGRHPAVSHTAAIQMHGTTANHILGSVYKF